MLKWQVEFFFRQGVTSIGSRGSDEAFVMNPCSGKQVTKITWRFRNFPRDSTRNEKMRRIRFIFLLISPMLTTVMFQNDGEFWFSLKKNSF